MRLGAPDAVPDLPATEQVVEVAGPQHQREFVVSVVIGDKRAEGSGKSKREAQEEAAAALLREVE